MFSQLVKEAKKRNIAVIAICPLASGLLGGEFKKETKFAENDLLVSESSIQYSENAVLFQPSPLFCIFVYKYHIMIKKDS